MNPLTKEQMDKENNNPVLKTAEEERSKTQALVQAANVSLWTAILTINGIFLAFTFNFFNKNELPQIIAILFTSLFTVPILLVLILFYLNKRLKEESNLMDHFTYLCILKKGREETYTNEAEAAISKKEKTKDISRKFNVANQAFGNIAIVLTFISVICVFLFVVFFDFL